MLKPKMALRVAVATPTTALAFAQTSFVVLHAYAPHLVLPDVFKELKISQFSSKKANIIVIKLHHAKFSGKIAILAARLSMQCVHNPRVLCLQLKSH